MAPNRDRPPPQSSCASSALGNQTDEDEPNPNGKGNHGTPNSTQPSGATQTLTNQEELARARRTAQNAVSTCYLAYNEPQLSNKNDKHRRHMIGYPCKITRQLLAAFQVTGTGDINPKEVPQLCVVWCSEAGRLFSALVNASHQAILHPTVVKYLPKVHVVSKDIHLLYSAIQHNCRAVLNAHSGALYLGVDAWQSLNTFDVLGVVIYCLVKGNGGAKSLEAIPLDFVCLSESHTSKYLANAVRLVVEKFGIQDKKKSTTTKNWSAEPNGSDSDESAAEYGNTEEQISLPHGYTTLDSDNKDQSNEETLGPEDENKSNFLSKGGIDRASKEESDDGYKASSCKRTLEKFCAISKELKYSPNSKAEFVRICRTKECPTPHNIQRDVQT
ncbi:hypothetical protein PSTG_00190 [Puccinia striiformis f. sp. tritici PST-78]|uniref:Uncharacterized protein n=1 Tax=Puccinia striiformis f. sp. tritici PST-78 TaxID=1165861 RepID=A0A0L0W5S1_9BASI|nr:hypothetical protein PSTG_00190 [Puccinia striiformis f. sp. tritici PST-78]